MKGKRAPVSVKTKHRPQNDPLAPVRVFIESDGDTNRLDWTPDPMFEHLSTVWGLMLVLVQGKYIDKACSFASWRKLDNDGKVQALGQCALLSHSDQGPLLHAGETLTFEVREGKTAQQFDA